MNTELDCDHPDKTTLLAILAIGNEEIDQRKFRDAQSVFLELDEMDSIQPITRLS
ncbi:hypothetical protein [Pseudomonas sp. HMWF021]|uniref:hypothetical protein n=1 Tax=Pseudomonas sp. HMWF021 TaxID=2056857 RepID=UPI0013049919|nr:hypothetical protein [Pseudomonas sp. HMWF021]